MSENANNETTNSPTIDSNSEQTIDKTEEQTKPIVPINRELIREDMVKTAVNFLLNPRVINSPLTQKRTFLLRKGLSLEEIDSAIDRMNRLNPNPNQSLAPNISNTNLPLNSNGGVVGPPVQPMPSFFVRSTQFVSNAALFGAFVYGAYVLYKRFVEPMIFEKQRKPHPFVAIQQQLDQLSKAMSLLQNNISSIESNIKRQIEEELRSIKAPEEVTLHELKSELVSIKALLVNRRQFAATPAVASIPLWQRNDNKDSNNKTENDFEEQMNGSVEDSDNNSNINSTNRLINGSTEPITTETITNGLQID